MGMSWPESGPETIEDVLVGEVQDDVHDYRRLLR